MPLWICDFLDCARPSVRSDGDCVICNRRLCSRHLQGEYHTCPCWEDAEAYDPAVATAEEHEVTSLIERINFYALQSRCSALRHGIQCSIPTIGYDKATRSSVMGGMNYHIEITFEDGVCWIARIRRLNATSPPPELQDFIIQSEVATLTFLQATAITTPKVYDFALESSDNTVGVGFILMEKLPGKPLRWSSTTRQQREKVMDQMADVFIDLRKYPFSAYGSLHTPGSMQIGPFADESFTNFENCHMRTSGPFLSSREYNVAYLNFIQALILRTEKYSNRPVDAYLIHRFLIDLIPHVFTSDPSGEFFLKHADDKGDHILVDEEFNVTGIIDWEWAHTAPAEVAFNSPIGFLPVGEFYDGNNNLGEDEAIFATQLESKGRHDLANFVQTGRVLHRFRFCCGYDLVDWDGFVGLFRGLREATGVDAGQDWPEWKASALKRYANDSRLQELLDREE